MNGWHRIRTVILVSALLAFTSVAAAEQVLVEIGSSTVYRANPTDPGINMTWSLPGLRLASQIHASADPARPTANISGELDGTLCGRHRPVVPIVAC